MTLKKPHIDIAIIGMSGRFPGANSVDTFWENIRNGVDSISRSKKKELLAEGIPECTLKNPNYVKAKGILDVIDLFDADFFGYPPREAERMDPQIRMLHLCVWEALEQAAYNPFDFEGLIGSFFGANENQAWLGHLHTSHGNEAENVDTFLVNYRDYIATRLSYNFNLIGPSVTMLTACSTSLVTIHTACQSLIQGECDMALAGGVSITLPHKSGYHYQEGLMVSKDGYCRTFDAAADGTVFGDGVGVGPLKWLDSALADHDTIHAVIKGSAINNDGNHKAGFTAPSIDGQEAVICAAHAAAGIQAESISYIEAHGTATKLGDPIEVKALNRVFGSIKGHRCALGSVKPNIGHTNIAAGVASLIKTVMMLKAKEIPPTVNFNKPNTEIPFEEMPFYVSKVLQPWVAENQPRRAGVSAFGFGGTNAHVIIEEAPPVKLSKQNIDSPTLLVLSARTKTALIETTANLSEHFNVHPELRSADVAWTLAAGRKEFSWRRYAVVDSHEDSQHDTTIKWSKPAAIKNTSDIAFLFPGQGAQYPGMGHAFFMDEPVYRNALNHCAQILQPLLNYDIRSLLHCAPDDLDAVKLIKNTTYAQPAIFCVSFAIAKLWMSWGIMPKLFVGHSIGEYVAACLAGVFSLDDALSLVAERGQLMQSLEPGSMLAITQSEKDIRPYLSDDINLAAVNSQSLCVLSGPDSKIALIEQELKSADIQCQYLHTSHAFHSQMMEPILPAFEKKLQNVQLNDPLIPIISTVTGELVQTGEMSTADYWIKNLRQTVRFSDAAKVVLRSSNTLLEVGPGRTLSTLCRMQPGIKPTIVSSIPGPTESTPCDRFIFESLGTLWQAGHSVAWSQVIDAQNKLRIPLPTYPFEGQSFPVSVNVAPIQSRLEQLHKNHDIDNWFYLPSWLRSVAPEIEPHNNSEKEICLVFVDAYGIADQLIPLLEQEGQQVITVYQGEGFQVTNNTFLIHPEHRCDYDSLFDHLDDNNQFPKRIIHCWSTGTQSLENNNSTVMEAQYIGFYSLLFLAQVMGQHNMTDDVFLTYISDGLHDVLGSEEIYPEKSTALGAIKVVSQEYPNFHCSAVDIASSVKNNSVSPDLLQNILNEILSRDSEPMIAYRNGHRWVQRFESIEVPPKGENTELRQNGVYLITGGLGGIGLELSKFLAKSFKARLVLMGRSPLPHRSQWPTLLKSKKTDKKTRQTIKSIKQIEKTGGQVLYIQANVSDEQAMEAAIQQVAEQWGSINGVIHAAGLSGEGILQLKRPESVAKIFAAKVQGTLVLDHVLKDMDLDFIVLCSSIASVLGGIGLGDYCAANLFLDSFATFHHPRRKSQIISINWDMWGEVGMGLTTEMPAEHQEWLDRELRDGIMSHEGVEVFQRILSWGRSPQIIVSTRDLATRVDLWIKREILKEKERVLEENAARPRYQRPNISSEFLEPRSETEKNVADIWGMLFGIENIGRDDNFYELGGHSLLATTLVVKLKRAFNTAISIRDIMDLPTVTELAELIDKQKSNEGK